MIQVGKENICIRGLLDSHGGDHAASTHGTENGQDFPVAAGRCFVDARAPRTTRIEPRHRSGNTAFIQENQLVERGCVDFLKKLRALLLIGFGVSLGGMK
jgi:hypothetical protein